MKKIIIYSLVILIVGITVGQVCLAVPDINSLTKEVAEGAGYDKTTSETSLSQTVGQVIKTVLGFVGVVFLALTVYAGFLWMTASGNEEMVTKATGIIKMATIGLIIVVSSYTITFFVLQKATTRTTPSSAVGANTGKCGATDALSQQPTDGWATAGGKAVACAGAEVLFGVGRGLKYIFYDLPKSAL